MRLIILGSGGYGRVVADVAMQTGIYDEIAFLDDHDTREDVLGKCEEYLQFTGKETVFYPAFGNNVLRQSWIMQMAEKGIQIATIIHPTAYISPASMMGKGCVVLPKAAVNSYTEIQDGCIINMGALIDHNCVIGAGSHICLGAIVKADNHIPACTKIEAGVVLENGSYK